MEICEATIKQLPVMPDEVCCTNEDKSKVHLQFRNALKNRQLLEIKRILDCHLCLHTTEFISAEAVVHEIFINSDNIYHQQISIVNIIKLLVDKGANVNAKDSEQQSLLQLAVKYRLCLVIEFLISQRVNLSERDSSGNSILHFLIMNESNTFEKELQARDLSKNQERQEIEKTSTDFIRWMLLTGVNVDCQNNNGDTALHLAAKHNLLHAIPLLLKFTRNVGICNINGLNAFQILLNSISNSFENSDVKENEPLLPTSILSNYYGKDYVDEIYEKFLSMKWRLSMDVTDDNGRTPVHHLLMQHRPKFVKSILDYFTIVNKADKQGNTILHIVMNNLKNNCTTEVFSAEYLEIIRLLMLKGANVHKMNNDRISPLLTAVVDHKLYALKLFKDHGVNFQNKCDYTQTLLHHICKSNIEMDSKSCREVIDFLIKEGCSVNAKDILGKTPLHYAAQCGKLKISEVLIEYGANIFFKDFFLGYTPLLEAAEYGHIQVLELLVKNRADVNDKTYMGQTALHLIKKPTKSVVEKLIELGARLDVEDQNGFLPFHESIWREDDHIIRRIMVFGVDVKDNADVLDDENYIMVSGFITDMIKFSQIKYLTKSKVDVDEPGVLPKIIRLKNYKISQKKSLYTLLYVNRNPKCALFHRNKRMKRLVTTINFKKQLVNAWLSPGKRDSQQYNISKAN